MDKKLEVDAFVIDYDEDEEYQAYFAKLDVMPDTTENVEKWNKWFENNFGKELKVTFEVMD